ncbi:hypothetical protein M8J76_000082 [Diaphorina citri]|nr:hypothetical protein M8J75_016291 [Diaphorina citri]KAI5723035.1 hypothetical protein M8J76_000082 [Diaphorina citri]KAI5727627.1 hypothetical protein M8J77_004813 [Diaphorina citri]
MIKIQRFLAGLDPQRNTSRRKTLAKPSRCTNEIKQRRRNESKQNKKPDQSKSKKRYTLTSKDKGGTSRDGKQQPNENAENPYRGGETSKRTSKPPSSRLKKKSRPEKQKGKDKMLELNSLLGSSKELKELFMTLQMQPSSDTELDEITSVHGVSIASGSTVSKPLKRSPCVFEHMISTRSHLSKRPNTNRISQNRWSEKYPFTVTHMTEPKSSRISHSSRQERSELRPTRRNFNSNLTMTPRCFCEYCMDIATMRPAHCKFLMNGTPRLLSRRYESVTPTSKVSTRRYQRKYYARRNNLGIKVSGTTWGSKNSLRT